MSFIMVEAVLTKTELRDGYCLSYHAHTCADLERIVTIGQSFLLRLQPIPVLSSLGGSKCLKHLGHRSF